jgi:Bacterial transcriptional activator domain
VLRVEPSELDLGRFEQLAGEARRAAPEAAARKLRDALALWRGPALADLAYEPFAQADRSHRPARRGRDASRLLADASLIVQRTAGIVAEPLLAGRGRRGVAALAEDAGLLVVGLSERWRQEGLGRARGELAAALPAPTVFVRRGTRPGGLAPPETRTRFSWSLTGATG